MKIFGFEINRPKKNIVADQIPEIKATIPDTIKPAMMARVNNPTLNYHATRRTGRGRFTPGEYNLAEMGRIEDTDSYVRQAFDKKVALMFKEGWDLTGPNPRTVKYVKTRLAQIARATRQPTEQLLRDIGSSLIRKSNTFVVKVRDTAKSGGRVRVDPGSVTKIKPVAGYFILPAETMEFKMTGTRISRWRQKMPNGPGDYKEWNPRDIIHFFFDRKDGFVFGTPQLTPVIDDIRALRKIEENIELLIYQHLFPLFQYKVGTKEMPASTTEEGEREIDVVKREIQFMPTEGGLVTPHRHEIVAIGAEGRALRAEGYVDHFKKRVFSGLGVSAVDMGEGETANRATADNMSRNMVDSVKDFQRIVEMFFNEHVITELLLESTFGNDVLDEENKVYLRFKEIDIDAQIKKEAHYADQYAKHVINHDEARTAAGREPWRIPSPEEVEAGTATAEQYPEWHRSFWKMIREPELLIQSIDEPYSPAAKAAAANNSLEMTESDRQEAGKEQTEKELTIEKERSASKRAAAAQTARKRIKKDAFLKSTFLEVKADVVDRISKQNSVDHDWIAGLIRTEMGVTIDRLVAEQVVSFRRGYSEFGSTRTEAFMNGMPFIRTQLRERAERYILRLTEGIISSLKRNVTEDMNAAEMPLKARAVFESVEYRTDFIEDVEVRKAETFGRCLGAKSAGYTEMTPIVSNEACVNCQEHAQAVLQLGFLVLDEIPPHHANCTCHLTVDVKSLNELVQDNYDPNEGLGDPVPENSYTTCPECGKTAMTTTSPSAQANTGIFTCKACGHKFQKVEDDEGIEDFGARKSTSKEYKFVKCMIRTVSRLTARHPDLTQDEIEERAATSCERFRDMLEEGEDMEKLLDFIDEVEAEVEDATLEECVVSVKKSLRKQNPDMSADKIKSRAFAICNSRKGNK